MLKGPFKLATSIAGAHRLLTASLLVGLTLLAGCSSGARAPVVDLSGGQPSASPAASRGTYIVKQGDTLYSISRATGVNVDALKRTNNIADPTQLRVGQVLKLSGSSAAAGSVAAPSTQAPEAPSSQPASPATTDGSTATTGPAVTPPPTPAKPEQPAPRAADASVINWAWPAAGEVIQAFSTATKGIDIAGTPGDPVLAAADGKVMYSGNGVRGLGNLIIINHQNGFITAYAHNRTLLVKTGQDVKRGTKVAELGQTDTTSPRLHFEVRRQGTPVNPLQYLPAR